MAWGTRDAVGDNWTLCGLHLQRECDESTRTFRDDNGADWRRSGGANVRTVQEPAHDVNALAKESQNPVGNLTSLPFQFNFNTGGDLDGQAMFNLNFQPVIPFQATESWNVIARTIVALDSFPGSEGARYSGVGNIQEQIVITPAKPRGIILGRGTDVLFSHCHCHSSGDGHLGARTRCGRRKDDRSIRPGWTDQSAVADFRRRRRTGDRSVHVAAIRQSQPGSRVGDCIRSTHHRQLGRARWKPVDRAAWYRTHANDSLQSAADESRRAVLLQRGAARRSCWTATQVHRGSAVPEMSAYCCADRIVSGSDLEVA
jgi:hypothetical protein